MINPSCSPHCLTDGTPTQVRNDSPAARLCVLPVACYTATTCSDGKTYFVAEPCHCNPPQTAGAVWLRHSPEQAHPEEREQGEDFSGIHHIGFVVDNVLACAERMEEAGATRLTPLEAEGRRGQAGRGQRPSNAEVKLSGPDGVIIDISEFGWLGNSL